LVGHITTEEIELLNAYQMLNINEKKEIHEFLRYVLCKQYKYEVLASVFNNSLLHNLFHSLLHIVERDDFDVNQIIKRVKQIKELYYGIFEQVHNKYAQIVTDLDSNEIVKEYGRNCFENLDRVLHGNNKQIIRLEIIDFSQEFNKLSKKHNTKKIVAV